ncbi:MAG: FkbM family methyltransferase [Paludibacteraceae bacterium]
MKIREYINRIWIYIKYPNTLLMDIRKILNKRKYKKYGLQGFAPNYIYFNCFNDKSTIIDVGCGFEAELSVTFIKKYNLNAFAVDPTLKHAPSLQAISAKYPTKFHHLPYALATQNGETHFYEAENCESGSLLKEHKNMNSNHNVKEYKVQLIDIPSLIKMTKSEIIDFLKIDIEGAEYTLFTPANLKAIHQVKQLFIEFHHLSVAGFTRKNTLQVVQQIEDEGFKSFSNDGVNYLFFN